MTFFIWTAWLAAELPSNIEEHWKSSRFLLRTYYICFGVSQKVCPQSFEESSSVVGVIMLSEPRPFGKTAFEGRPVVLIPLARVPERAGLEAFIVVKRCRSVICMHCNWASGFRWSFTLYFHWEQLVEGGSSHTNLEANHLVCLNIILCHLGSDFLLMIRVMHSLGKR